MNDETPSITNDPGPDARFLKLFVANEKALRVYARALVPTWDAVDDILQEASLVMWRKLDQLDSSKHFLAWAKVIVRFEALRSRRKFARDRLVFGEELLTMLATEADKHEEDTLILEKTMLKQCLGNLSLSHQQLLLAPYGGSGQIKELAEQSNRTPNSLYKLMGRLREKLQRCIETELGRANRLSKIQSR